MPRTRKNPDEKWLSSIPLPVDLHRAFASRCALEGRDLREVVRLLITAYAERRVGVEERAAGKTKRPLDARREKS